MTKTSNLLCFFATGALASAQYSTRWAEVPALRDAASVRVLSVPRAPTEDDVRLVGPALPSNATIWVPAPVFSVELDASSEAPSPAKDTALELPGGTRWPDSFGRIVAVLPKPAGDLNRGAARNPWRGRALPKSKSSENDFQCGGLIVGGEGGSIAFLNGRTVRRGDDLGKFRVKGIVGEGVIMESAGLYFMIPVLRRTTIAIVEE